MPIVRLCFGRPEDWGSVETDFKGELKGITDGLKCGTDFQFLEDHTMSRFFQRGNNDVMISSFMN